ncbi:MAG: alpha-(1-_3)-arabinofuranosyltransferase family protein [Acidimicrobiia bacterium]
MDWMRRRLHLGLALIAYLPMLATARGKVPGDTKLYLYLDPWRLMSDAAYSWDSRQFGGWVPHQNVGYLWPTGPWFGAFDLLRVPDWVAHRLWVGTLLFVAGAGVVHLGRRLGLSSETVVVAAVAYELSPYVLPYVSRTSALLLPWALLGWIVAVSIDFVREPRLGRLAVFALLIASSGGLNATALLMIAPAPIAVIIDHLWRREIRWTAALARAAQLGVTAILASLWWIVGLVIQGRHGSAVLSYTEALPSTAATSTAAEVVRGLGYWLFYDRNDVVALTSASTPHLTNPLVLVIGASIAVGGLVGLTRLSARVRRPLSMMLLAGVILSVGAFPYSSPTPFWRLLVDRPQSAVSLALRSSTRAAPLVVLALAFGLGHLVRSLVRRYDRPVLVPVVLLLIAANQPALFTGRIVDPVLVRPEALPTAWTDAARFLDERYEDGHTGAVLMLPGIESAAFRWGYPVDPILPGTTVKPMLNRDWIPQGSAAQMDLLYALDDRFQDGTADPKEIAPIARLLGVDTVMVVNSYQYERFGLPQPERSVDVVANAPGLVHLGDFGAPTENVGPTTVVPPRRLPEISLYAVDEFSTGMRVETSPVVVSGDGTGLVDAARAGVIDGRTVVLTSAAFSDATNPTLEQTLGAANELVVTDGNRRRAHHWRGSQDVWGATEGERPTLDVPDVFDNRLPVFPAADGDTSTHIADERSWITTATAYGAALSYFPEYRPTMATDGDPATAWLVGWGQDPVGKILTIHVRDVLDHLELVPAPERPVTAFSISVDGGPWRSSAVVEGRVDIDPAKRDVRLRIDAVAARPSDAPSGWAEVLPTGSRSPEWVRVPSDATSVVGPETPVSYVFARLLADPLDERRHDPETAIRRDFDVAHADSFTLTGHLGPALRETLTLGSSSCRDDLLDVDGESVAVRVDGDGLLEACEPLALDAGNHLLWSPVDGVTLRSERASRPDPSTTVPETRTRTTRSSTWPACSLCWVEGLDGANGGWSGSVDGRSVGAPAASGAGRDLWTYSAATAVVFDATWTPQRLMWWGIGVSLAFVLGALVVLAVGPWRRRPIGRASVARPSTASSRRTVVAGTLGVIALFVHPLTAVVAAGVAAAARRRLLERTLVAVVAIGFVYVVVQQVRYGTPAGFGWPGVYAKVHGAMFAATLTLGLLGCFGDTDDELDVPGGVDGPGADATSRISHS